MRHIINTLYICGKIILLFAGVVRLAPNVAFKGTATQSYNSNAASRVIDGNFEGSCSYTSNNQQGWWQVDLLEVYMITKVAMTAGRKYSRSSACSLALI